MKRNWKNRIWTLALLVGLIGAFAGCTRHEHSVGETYTCPMHPTVIADRPGSCPVCGMDLVRKSRPGDEVAITEDLSKLIKSPNEVVIARVSTVKGTYGKVPVSLNASGIVTYDSRKIHTLSSRVAGRLEKVFLKFPYQPVSKGERVAEIYSPELITAQRELRFLVENDPENEDLISAVRQRLLLLGATDRQINSVMQTGTIANTFAIFSPYNGYIVPDNLPVPAAAIPATAGVSSGGAMPGGMMGNTAPNPSSPQPDSPAGASGTLIREGNYVATGQTLFRIIDPSSILVEINLPVSLASHVTKDDEVEIDVGSGHTRSAQVNVIQPFFSQGQEFVTIRAYIRQTENMPIGSLVKTTIKSEAIEALWVPRASVVDLGMESILFVKEGEVFKPRKVTTGYHAKDVIEIKGGLSSSEEIASNAQYLVDSESFIKPQQK